MTGTIRQKTNTSQEYSPELSALLAYEIHLGGIYFLVWEKQTGLVCAGQQNKEALDGIAPRSVIRFGLWLHGGGGGKEKCC